MKKIKNNYQDYLNWLNIRAQRRDDYWSLYNKTNALLKASCPDGYLRIHQDVYPTASKMLTKCFEQHQQLLSDFDNNLQRMETDLARRRDATSMISATFSLISIAASVRGVAEAGRSAIRELGEEILQEMGFNTVQAVYEHLIRNEFYTSDDMSNWFSHASSDLIKSYVDLQKLITESYKSCKEEKENKGGDRIMNEAATVKVKKSSAFGEFIYRLTKSASAKIGRNDPCPCGSGKKYKNCCMNKE